MDIRANGLSRLQTAGRAIECNQGVSVFTMGAIGSGSVGLLNGCGGSPIRPNESSLLKPSKGLGLL